MKKNIVENRNIYKKAILISLKLLILFTPLAAYKHVDYFRDNQEAWLKLFVIIALTLWVLKYFKEQKNIWVKSPLNLHVYLFIIIMSISLMESKFLIVSLRGYLIFLSYFLIYFLVINNIENEQEFYSFIKLFFIISFFISIYTLIQYYGLDPYLRELGALTSTIGQKNWISNYLALIFPMIFSFFLLEEIKKNKILLFLLLSIIYANLMICQSRGIWISICLTLILAIYTVIKFNIFEIFKKNKKWLIILLSVFIIITIIYSIDNPLNKDLLTVPQRALSTFDQRDLSINMRLLNWKNTYQMIKDKPFFGLGIGTFKMNYLDYQAEFLKNNPVYREYWVFPREAHNEYLQIGAELGLLGLGLFMAIILIFYSTVLNFLKKEQNSKNRLVVWGLLTGISCFLIHSLFTFPLHVPALGSAFFTIIGLTTIYIRNFNLSKFKKEKIIKKFKNKRPIFKIVCSILAVIIMIIAVDSLVIRPYLSEVCSYKGKDNLAEGNYREALSNFEYGEKLDPYNGNILINLGATYFNLGVYNKVEGIFRRAENYIKDKNIYLNLGLYYIQSGKYKEAEEEFKYAIYLDPKFTKVYYSIGYLYFIQKEYDKAIYEWNKILEIEPNYSEKYNVLYFMGLTYQKKQMPDKALEYYLQALQLAPEGSPIMEEIEREIYNIYRSKLDD
jgi:O-antigen ligase/Tfp pilus assembly protein PilF